jgi:AraC family transcriptional regulator, transcriptional activator of pobA
MVEKIKKLDFKEGIPNEFEIVSLTKLLKENKALLTTPHRTAFYHIIWFQKGNPVHIADFNPIPIKPDTLLFINKDTVQIFDHNIEFEAKAILFTDGFFCRTENDVRFLRSTILFNDLLGTSTVESNHSAALNTLFKLMETEFENEPEMFQADVLHNYLQSFLLVAERERRKQNFQEFKKSADLDYTLLYRDLVEKDFRQVKQVSTFATQLSVTEKRLYQATTKIFGKSPKNIIDERVMLEAKRLLAHTNESIKEIGYSLGFQEPTNFIKYFRKHYGTTPVEFREKFSQYHA